MFVGFFQLMNSSFEIKSQSQTVGKIHLGVYNNNTGEMITVGPGFITVSYSHLILSLQTMMMMRMMVMMMMMMMMMAMMMVVVVVVMTKMIIIKMMNMMRIIELMIAMMVMMMWLVQL